MKQFMVVKLVQQAGSRVTNVIPPPGLLAQEAAEEVLEQAHRAEPDSVFVLQEVGAA